MHQGKVFLDWHLLPHTGQVVFEFWGQMEGDLLASSHTNQCQYYYTLENPLPFGGLGLNAFNHSWTYQVSYVFHPMA